MTPSGIRKAIFPVGGLGTRFLPATKCSPKEMLPVVDKPLIQYAVEEAKLAGIEQFIFVTGRGKSAIEDFFDYSYELNAELTKRGKARDLDLVNNLLMQPGQVSYIRQQEPLGLGHAVWCARHLIGNEPFAVLLADDLFLSDVPCLKQMIDQYQQRPCNMVALMPVEKNKTKHYGIIEVKSQKGPCVWAKDIVEKPDPDLAPSTMAVIGRYILDPCIFDILGDQDKGVGGEIQLTDAIKKMLSDKPLMGYLFEGKRFDCGAREGLLEATVAFALSRADLKQDMQRILQKYAV